MLRLAVTDMHTGGEPLRIVTGGYPDLPSCTLLEKRTYVAENLDHLRRFLMHEPRGHAEMYGALLVEPDDPQADLAVLFMHNQGYSTMCGHAIIALGRYALDQGLVARGDGETLVRIQAPCGLITARVDTGDSGTGEVTFSSVPSFVHTPSLEVVLDHAGKVICDVVFGGAFYAIADCRQFGLEFGASPVRDFVDAAETLSNAVADQVDLAHPIHDDLAFLYGSILTDGGRGDRGIPSLNVCVFAGRQVDRSPTGSGVSARLALQFALGEVDCSEGRIFESIAGSRFTGSVESRCKCGDLDAVTTRVGGKAHYCGTAEFLLEDDDILGRGFLLR